MLLSTIDVGSNSVRLLIGEVVSGKVIPARYERVVTRLAAGIESTGLLADDAMEKTLKVLKDFSRTIRSLEVRHIKCIGTSALREGGNACGFLDRVKAETGLAVEVVTGEREAALTAKGMLASFKRRGHWIIIDIGGGSTEWAVCRDDRVVRTGTLPAGVVKLLERHLISDPPTADELEGLDNVLKRHALRVRDEVSCCLGAVLIGTAGTATTLAAIDLGLEPYDPQKVHMHTLTLERLRGISSALCSVSLAERAGTRGLEPSRADLIIPGIRFTIKLMEALGFDSISISAHGLLEGALVELSTLQ